MGGPNFDWVESKKEISKLGNGKMIPGEREE